MEKTIATIKKYKRSDEYGVARRFAKMYGAVHGIDYKDVIGMALEKFLDKKQLKEDVIEFLSKNNFKMNLFPEELK